MRWFILLSLLSLTGCQSATDELNTGVETPITCQVNADCPSGQACQGQGCPGDQSTGICVDPGRPCTMDLATYCGCDGVEFYGSGSCPNARYAHKGACLESDLPDQPLLSDPRQ